MSDDGIRIVRANAPRGEHHRIPVATKGARLCIDIGTHMGWAIRLGRHTRSGTKDFSPGPHDPIGTRFHKFRAWLLEIIDHNPIGEIYFEDVRGHKGTDAAHIYGGFLAHLTEVCVSRNMSCRGVHTATIKQHVTGKGNAKKQEVMAALRGLGYTPKDDNEGDALALLDYICGDEK